MSASRLVENRREAAERKPDGAVLIVEDDADIRQVLSLILQEGGYQTVEAANGREALERLKARTDIAIILLDLLMPVMNGWEFQEELRKDARLAEIPVIVMTAWGAPSPTGQIKAVDRLAKPVRLQAVLESVRRQFDTHVRGRIDEVMGKPKKPRRPPLSKGR